MATPIEALEALPETGLTISALEALDFVVPGEWQNVRSFDALIAEVTGIDKPGVVAAVRRRAEQLQTTDLRYAQAIQIYTLVDTVDQVAAGAAVASKVGGLLGSLGGSLGFLEKITPKPETTQSIDAGLKLIAELVAFGRLNGMPNTSPEGLARFAGALTDYGRYDLMRIAAWVVFDGLLPLGPDFVAKLTSNFKGLASDKLVGHDAFKSLSAQLPGATASEKQAFIVKTLDSTAEWITGFVEEKGLTQEKIMGQLKGSLSLAQGSMDYVAAAIDASTNHTTHTGTQTVARALARHSYEQVRQEVWDQWVAGQ